MYISILYCILANPHGQMRKVCFFNDSTQLYLTRTRVYK